MDDYVPGSRADFERLYRASYRKVVLMLTAMLRNPASAEDCAQMAFEKAYSSWGQWQPTAPAEAWVMKIAHNTAISHIRKEKIRSFGETVRRLGAPLATPDPAEGIGNEVVAAIAKLPRRQAAVVVLRHHHGYTNRDIAHVLGISESTVASHLAAALASLRVTLGDHYDNA